MSYHRIASALRPPALRLAVSQPRYMTGLSALARAACRQKQAPPVPVLDSDCSSSWQDMTPIGTGETMVVLSFRAAAGMGAAFERVVQQLSLELDSVEAGVSDVRVMAGAGGEATFVVTLLSRAEAQRFERTIRPSIQTALAEVSEGGEPCFSSGGMLVPHAHTLGSLLQSLTRHLSGTSRTAEHDVRAVAAELRRWYPRKEEYGGFLSVDEDDPGRYTRNVVHSTPAMEVLMMCWPPGSQSTIHCHDESSCWVTAVEGEVHEVQFDLPLLDRKFERARARLEGAPADPAGHIRGRCGPLRRIRVSPLGGPGDGPELGCKQTYANNEIGIHRIENRSLEPAVTMHVYAPRLRKMKIFRDSGEVSEVTVTSESTTVEDVGSWQAELLDVAGWNGA